MRNLSTVTCSLNLGLIYSVDYSYTPESGVSMTLFFVKENGLYQQLDLLPLRKVSVTVGPARFSLYLKSYKISRASGRKVISVELVDENFMLDNYYIVLGDNGCGQNVFSLGSSVDTRTVAQKLADALDPSAEKIKAFTEFPDLEYKFDEFLTVLRRKFSVSVNANYDGTITKRDTGTFRSVLSSWCDFYNLSFYFENSQIKIYDPTRLTINIPTQITDMISYDFSEDVGSTYGKTVCNFFKQKGGEKPFNDTEGTAEGDGNSNSIKSLTLYPIGSEFNLQQTMPDLKQVAAAMYGQEFWFLYNLANDEISKCGWEKKSYIWDGKPTLEGSQLVFDEKFKAYYDYGNSIAGKWYISNEIDSVDILRDCIWISEVAGPVFDLNSDLAKERRIGLEFLEPPSAGVVNFVDKTEINDYFDGVRYVGKRLAFIDERDRGRAAAFAASDALKQEIADDYKAVVPDGNRSVSLKGIPGLDDTKNHLNYVNNTFQGTSLIRTLIDSINDGEKTPFLSHAYTSYAIKGARSNDIINNADLTNQPDELAPVSNGSSNTSVIKVKKDGAYAIYYEKYSKCVSKSSAANFFQHKFEINEVSDDYPVVFTFNKVADTYTITRNYAAINAVLNNPYLQSLAQPRNFTTKTATFSVNYFYPIPVDFISNGLVGMQMSVTDGGVSCSYTFSNSVLQPPNNTDKFQKFESQMRESWKRKYSPQEVIT